MRNRSPYGPWPVFWNLQTIRATDFTLSKTFETAQRKCCAVFFANFCLEIGCETDQTYIFRFVKYLSTFFYTYLPVNIHFQLIIITKISILTDPDYFVPPSCHCGILALRSHDFWETTNSKTCSLCLHEKLVNVKWEYTSIGITIEENIISS